MIDWVSVLNSSKSKCIFIKFIPVELLWIIVNVLIVFIECLFHLSIVNGFSICGPVVISAFFFFPNLHLFHYPFGHISAKLHRCVWTKKSTFHWYRVMLQNNLLADIKNHLSQEFGYRKLIRWIWHCFWNSARCKNEFWKKYFISQYVCSVTS